MKIALQISAYSLTIALLNFTTYATVPICPHVEIYQAVLFPDDQNCSQYYMCDHGTAVVQSCPDYLYFNPAVNTCDYKEHINASSCTPHKGSTTSIIFTTVSTESTDFSSNTESTDFTETSISTTTTFTTSTDIYSSDSTDPTPTLSTDSMYTSTDPTTSTTTSNSVTCDPDLDQIFPDPANCSRYIICSYGKLSIHDCRNTHNNKKSGLCQC